MASSARSIFPEGGPSERQLERSAAFRSIHAQVDYMPPKLSSISASHASTAALLAAKSNKPPPSSTREVDVNAEMAASLARTIQKPIERWRSPSLASAGAAASLAHRQSIISINSRRDSVSGISAALSSLNKPAEEPSSSAVEGIYSPEGGGDVASLTGYAMRAASLAHRPSISQPSLSPKIAAPAANNALKAASAADASRTRSSMESSEISALGAQYPRAYNRPVFLKHDWFTGLMNNDLVPSASTELTRNADDVNESPDRILSTDLDDAARRNVTERLAKVTLTGEEGNLAFAGKAAGTSILEGNRRIKEWEELIKGLQRGINLDKERGHGGLRESMRRPSNVPPVVMEQYEPSKDDIGSVLETAERNVKARLELMNKDIAEKKMLSGKLQREHLGQRDNEAKEVEEKRIADAEHRRTEDIDTYDIGGRTMTRLEVEAIAQRHVKEVLDEIDQKVELERERIDTERLEKEDKLREQQHERDLAREKAAEERAEKQEKKEEERRAERHEKDFVRGRAADEKAEKREKREEERRAERHEKDFVRERAADEKAERQVKKEEEKRAEKLDKDITKERAAGEKVGKMEKKEEERMADRREKDIAREREAQEKADKREEKEEEMRAEKHERDFAREREAQEKADKKEKKEEGRRAEKREKDLAKEKIAGDKADKRAKKEEKRTAERLEKDTARERAAREKVGKREKKEEERIVDRHEKVLAREREAEERTRKKEKKEEERRSEEQRKLDERKAKEERKEFERKAKEEKKLVEKRRKEEKKVSSSGMALATTVPSAQISAHGHTPDPSGQPMENPTSTVTEHEVANKGTWPKSWLRKKDRSGRRISRSGDKKDAAVVDKGKGLEREDFATIDKGKDIEPGPLSEQENAASVEKGKGLEDAPLSEREDAAIGEVALSQQNAGESSAIRENDKTSKRLRDDSVRDVALATNDENISRAEGDRLGHNTQSLDEDPERIEGRSNDNHDQLDTDGREIGDKGGISSRGGDSDKSPRGVFREDFEGF